MSHHYLPPGNARSDQERINAACRHTRRIINELTRVRNKDDELTRVLRGMYTVEDILSQYAATLDRIKEG